MVDRKSKISYSIYDFIKFEYEKSFSRLNLEYIAYIKKIFSYSFFLYKSL